MKFVISILFTFCCVINSQAELYRLEGVTYIPKTNLDIVWSATNSFPNGLWVYKTLPYNFSMSVVSNAMRLGHFDMKDLAKGESAFFQDKNLIAFVKRDGHNHRQSLYIAPSLGLIEFSSVGNNSGAIENVPTADEAVSLARDVLFQLGIDRALLSERVQTGYDDTRTKIDRQGNKLSEVVVFRRGVAFARQIDGVKTSDSRCFLIHFGNNGSIEDFSLKWRNIIPFESHPVLSKSKIIALIKSGQSVIPEQFDDTTILKDATKLNVLSATPTYYNGRIKEPLEFLYPYLELKVSAELNSGESSITYLHCPILSTDAFELQGK